MFQNIFSFDGRIRRLEYGLSVLGYVVAYLLLATILGGELGDRENSSPLLFIVFMIPMFWILMAQAAKRCHDLGNSGWWQLIPFYGFWLLFADGQPYENEFGPDPKGRGDYTPSEQEESSIPNPFDHSDVLDAPLTVNTGALPSGTPIWDTVTRYGAYCGGILVALSVITYLLDVNMMSISGTLLMAFITLASGFAMAALGMRYQRDRLDGGILSYGKAFGIGVLILMVGMALSSVWNYVFINFIDPEYMVRLKEEFISAWGERLPPESLDQATESFDKAGEPLTLLKNTLIGGSVYGLIIGLITAAFMKRDPKPSYMR